MALGKYAKQTFNSIKKATLKKPALFLLGLKIIQNQKIAAKKREKYLKQGLQVPSFLIFSVTDNCNLNCKGCYHRAKRKAAGEELSDKRIEKLFWEAEELGISNIILAGGEPLLRKKLLDIAARFPRILFLLFTNGLLVDDEIISKFKKAKSIIPIISLEGESTDLRRGAGIYARVMKAMQKLSEGGIVFGNAITVTRKNLKAVTSKKFVEELVGFGSSVLFFADYVPMKLGTENLMPTALERKNLVKSLKEFRRIFPAVFFSTADEDEFGGCISAGIGFLHISPSGDVEPCPMAPYSDVNIKNTPLKKALTSKFLKSIRENRSKLSEHDGGCALYAKRNWVKKLLG